MPLSLWKGKGDLVALGSEHLSLNYQPQVISIFIHIFPMHIWTENNLCELLERWNNVNGNRTHFCFLSYNLGLFVEPLSPKNRDQIPTAGVCSTTALSVSLKQAASDPENSDRGQGVSRMDFGTNLLVAWSDWDSQHGKLSGSLASCRRRADQHPHSWNTHPLSPLWLHPGSCASHVASSWISWTFLQWQWVDSGGQILISQHPVNN